MSGLRSRGAWGRGNGWVAMTCGELLDLLDPDSQEYRAVGEILRRLIDELIPLQSESGLWRTILNLPEAYEESSATAMFLFGMLCAERHGLLEPGGSDGRRGICKPLRFKGLRDLHPAKTGDPFSPPPRHTP